MSVTVHTQDELDQALADRAEFIHIEPEAHVWLTLTHSGSSRVVAWGSSHVEARESSHVVARESSHVVARGSSHVVAWESSRVEAWESSRVVARGSSHVVAWESSRVEAWESSHVEARGSSHVEAWGSSHVVARGSSHVEAWESSHVEARESSRVEASKYVGVHLWSQHVTLTGGQVIDLTEIDFNDPAQWCEFSGVEVIDGIAYLYKAVGEDWKSDYGTEYSPGSTPEAPDWEEVAQCGQGLHFCAHPQLSLTYKPDAARFVKVGVRLDEMVTFGDKAKTKRVVVPCVEVDEFGEVTR